MSGRAPLTPRQQRAAALIGQGWEKQRAAGEVGCHPRTISKWVARDDFAALVEKARATVLSKVPTAQATLEAALGATRTTGSPDWAVRVSAARALIGIDGPARTPPPDVGITFHTENLDEEE